MRGATPLATELAFLDFKPVKFSNDELSIEDLAGAVRQYKSGKTVVLNSEGPCEIKVAGKTVTGRGAFVVEIVGKDTKIVYRAEEGEVNIQ